MKRAAIKKLKTIRILERVEVDAVNLSVGIIDDADNYLGTVTLYVCIDCFSRAVLGFCVQLGRGENSSSVIESYKHAIAPKQDEHIAQCKNDWPMRGLMDVIVADGGTGYKSSATSTWLMVYNIAPEFVEVRSGWKKPFVESFFVSLRAKFAAELPGYVGKRKANRKSDLTVKEQAVMTLEDFKLQLTRFIVDEYHQVKHSGLNEQSPQEAWTKSARIFTPALPDDLSEFDICEGTTESRTIQGHKGVQINNIFYNDENGLLVSLYNLLKQTQTSKPVVLCQYSKNDISRIAVFDPVNDETFEVETHDERVHSGMPLAEFQAKYPSKSQKKKDIDTTQYSDDNPELERLQQAHREKCKKKSSRSLAVAKIDELTKQTLEEKLRIQQAATVKNSIKSSTQIIEEDDDDDAVDAAALQGAYGHG